MNNPTLIALVAKTLREIGEYKDQYRPYCGRGMSGNSCIAIVVENGVSDIIEIIGQVIEEIGSDVPATEITEILSHVQSDNLGYDTVYYWRQMTVEFEDDSEDED